MTYRIGTGFAGKEIELLEKENAELKDKLNNWVKCAELRLANWQKYKKENKQLKTQIEKMKCSQNCKHLYINLCDFNFRTCSNCKDKWELKE